MEQPSQNVICEVSSCQNKVSLGRAAELSRTALAAFMDFAAHHEVSPLRYGDNELEEDRNALSELGL